MQLYLNSISANRINVEIRDFNQYFIKHYVIYLDYKKMFTQQI